MLQYLVTKRHRMPRLPRIDRDGSWPRVTFLFWTWDCLPDAIFARVKTLISELRKPRTSAPRGEL